MRGVTITKTVAAAQATGIAVAQAVLAAPFALNLNGALVSGGVATMDTQRRVILTSTGNDSANFATVVGTDDSGAPIKDTFALTNAGVAQSNLDFLTVTSINLSAAAAANISAGTNNVASTPWQLADTYLNPVNIGFLLKLISGAGLATLEYTDENVLRSPNGIGPAIAYAPATIVPLPIPHPDLTALAATKDGAITWPVNAWRLTLTNAAPSSWEVAARQAGLWAA